MKRCKFCGAMLDAEEKCDCQKKLEITEVEEVVEAEELKLEVIPFEPINKIEFNKTELEEKLKAHLMKYENLVITKDMTVDMKRERAKLNKLSKALNDEKIRQKKIFSEPIIAFEKEVKELISKVDEVVKTIDVQLNNFDEQEKQEKISQLRNYFDENIGELKEKGITFESIYRKEWGNKSETLKSCQNSIKNKFTMITGGLEVIKSTHPDIYLDCEIEYLKNYNLVEALEFGNTLKLKKEAVKKMEAQQKAIEQLEKLPEEQSMQKQEQPTQEEILNVICPEDKTAKLFKVVFELNESLEVLNDLKAYMDNKKINYRVIK